MSTSPQSGAFKPSTDAIAAAESLFATMALRQMIEPLVLGYQAAILAKHRWPIAKKWADTRLKLDGPILKPEQSYLLEDEDFQNYLQCCYAERDKAKLVGNHAESCPLLEAMELERQAQHWLLRSMEERSPVTLEKATAMPMAAYKQVIDLTLKLLAPYVNPHRRFDIPQNVSPSAASAS